MDGVSLALNWYLSNNLNLMLDWAYDNRYNVPIGTPGNSQHDPGPHERLRHQAAVPILAIGPNNLQFLQETIAMSRYLFGLIGLALLCGGPLLGQAPDGRSLQRDGLRPGDLRRRDLRRETGCNACDNCCPNCGCRLVPVCHVYCATKKVTEHKYTCICEEVCIPGCSLLLQAVRQLRRFRLVRRTPATTVARRAAGAAAGFARCPGW